MIETKEATLATLSVEIQSLRVSGKQMTLAVFRQLPEGGIGEEDDGEIWGTVRYKIKHEGNIHLVYSKEGQLFRREIKLNDPSEIYLERAKNHISVAEQNETGRCYLKEYPDYLRNNIVCDSKMTSEEHSRACLKLKSERIAYLNSLVKIEEEVIFAKNQMRDKEKAYLEDLPQLFISV